MQPIDLATVREFNHLLARVKGKEEVLFELIKVIDAIAGVRNCAFYMLDRGFLEPSVFYGKPDLLINLESNLKLKVYEVLHQTNQRGELVVAGSELFRMPAGVGIFQSRIAQQNCALLVLGCGVDIIGFGIMEFKTKRTSLKDILTILANQAYLALRYIAMEEEKNQLDKVVESLLTSLDVQRAYPVFVQELKKLVHFDRLTLTLPDEQKGELMVYAQFDEVSAPNPIIPLEGSAPAMVISTGRYIVEEDLQVERLFVEDDFLLSIGIRCAIRLPLVSKGRVIGTLNVNSKTPRAWDSKHIRILQSICQRIAAYVENGLVYEVVNNQLKAAMLELQKNHGATLEAFTVVLDQRDSGTNGHCQRVTDITLAMGTQFGISGLDLEDLKYGALLHDIGKIGIPDSVLFKPGKLTDHEWAVMRNHPLIGYDMVSKIEFMRGAIPVVLHHHERYDGAGYPHGLAKSNIPIGARIFAIADSFDAMTSDRPYRKGMSAEAAIEEIKVCSGKQFCPECVELFIRCYNDQDKPN